MELLWGHWVIEEGWMPVSDSERIPKKNIIHLKRLKLQDLEDNE